MIALPKPALICLIALGLTQSYAFAEEAKPATISVSATGTMAVVPDMATVRLGVVREAKTARQALDANSQAMTAVLASMKDAGVEDKDLQTSSFNIQPRYIYPRPQKSGEQKQPTIVGYMVSNALTIRVRDLSRLGTILDEAVTLGVNSDGNISFASSTPEVVLEQARKKAVTQAVAKAKTLTEAANVGLGRILSINENGARAPRPRALQRTAAFKEDAAVPIASGESSYSITVNMTWELAQ